MMMITTTKMIEITILSLLKMMDLEVSSILTAYSSW